MNFVRITRQKNDNFAGSLDVNFVFGQVVYAHLSIFLLMSDVWTLPLTISAQAR